MKVDYREIVICMEAILGIFSLDRNKFDNYCFDLEDIPTISMAI